MLSGLDENERDVIEEQCVERFGVKGKRSAKPDQAIVREQDFKNWWSEGKLDGYEVIKYYLIPFLAKQVKDELLDEQHFKRFQSYEEK